MAEQKTRALRKYEGDHTVVAVDAGHPELSFFAPFGPLIGHSRIEPALVAALNAYADRVATPGQGSEFMIPPEVAQAGGAQSLLACLEGFIGRYVGQTERVAAARIQIDAIWVVSQYASTPSPMHFHTGDVSGVLYLRTPQVANEDAERQKTYISGRQAGDLNFILGGKQRFSRTVTSVRPDVGDLYLFPGWLLHGAEPFRGEGERRSLAFNAFVTTAD